MKKLIPVIFNKKSKYEYDHYYTPNFLLMHEKHKEKFNDEIEAWMKNIKEEISVEEVFGMEIIFTNKVKDIKVAFGK